MKRITALILAILMLLATVTGCVDAPTGDTTTDGATTTTAPEETTTAPTEECRLNGVPLEEYTIVYAADEPEYTKNAATYIADAVKTRTGIELTVTDDATETSPLTHEILVGDTTRELSRALDAETEGLEFALMADGGHVAMEGDYFIIAAAAYYFVETYVTGETFDTAVATTETVCTPIVKEARNFIMIIGDGMGEAQTNIFSAYSALDLQMESDGEGGFYGYMLPYHGWSRTDSLSGTTDSAAGGTALATGYKTYNKYIGKDENLNDVKSLTEMAAERGMATAVLSTETTTGATPATFTVHVEDREESSEILLAQYAMKEAYGTIIEGGYSDNYSRSNVRALKKLIRNTLSEVSADEDGFFMMYEESYIDKHCHSNNAEKTFRSMVRLNQAIGVIMEFVFYHPETMVIITADHETGGLAIAEDGTCTYSSEDHTSVNVPVFAYGAGAEVFHGVTVENIQIPKTIAAMWGIELIGYDNRSFPSLIDVNVDE